MACKCNLYTATEVPTVMSAQRATLSIAQYQVDLYTSTTERAHAMITDQQTSFVTDTLRLDVTHAACVDF